MAIVNPELFALAKQALAAQAALLEKAAVVPPGGRMDPAAAAQGAAPPVDPMQAAMGAAPPPGRQRRTPQQAAMPAVAHHHMGSCVRDASSSRPRAPPFGDTNGCRHNTAALPPQSYPAAATATPASVCSQPPPCAHHAASLQCV